MNKFIYFAAYTIKTGGQGRCEVTLQEPIISMSGVEEAEERIAAYKNIETDLVIITFYQLLSYKLLKEE